MTETTGACIGPSKNAKPETIGRLAPGMKAKVIKSELTSLIYTYATQNRIESSSDVDF